MERMRRGRPGARKHAGRLARPGTPRVAPAQRMQGSGGVEGGAVSCTAQGNVRVDPFRPYRRPAAFDLPGGRRAQGCAAPPELAHCSQAGRSSHAEATNSRPAGVLPCVACPRRRRRRAGRRAGGRAADSPSPLAPAPAAPWAARAACLQRTSVSFGRTRRVRGWTMERNYPAMPAADASQQF